MKKAGHCKLYQEQILETDKSINAFGVCPMCLWDVCEHDHSPLARGNPAPAVPGNYLHPVNSIVFFPSHIFHICILFVFDEFQLMGLILWMSFYLGVAQVDGASNVSMFEWLAQKSGENILTAEEQVLFWTKFAGYSIPLKERKLSVQDTRKLVKTIRSYLRSQTAWVMQAEGYIFDGLLGQTGGGRALLYHVIDAQKPSVFCGKVYCMDADNEQTISVEINSSKKLHEGGIHPHIVHYMDWKSFSHYTAPSKSMIVLIMPLYQLSLTSLLEALFNNPMSLEMFQTLTSALLSACCRFEELDKCHGDVKPENIMISNGTFILIDLGAVTDFNKPLREFTEGYYLDSSVLCANSTFDLNCIAVTLGRCCIKDFEAKRGRTRAKYLEMLDLQAILPQYKNAIRVCLTSSRCKDAQESLRVDA